MLVKRNHSHHLKAFAKIELNKGRFAIVDFEDAGYVRQWKWRAFKSHYKYYAARRVMKDGRLVTIKLHRLLARTPPGMVCHHENRNTLDNRKSNLTNMFPEQHYYEHGWR